MAAHPGGERHGEIEHATGIIADSLPMTPERLLGLAQARATREGA